MGLLDDAIREHMELKRLRGADPGEVARQEHDALGPVVRERGEAEGDLEDDDAEHTPGIEEPASTADAEEPASGEDDRSAAPPAHGTDFANVGEETAEIDMRTVLDEHHHEAEDPALRGEHADTPATPGEGQEPVEDVLEETPDFLRDTPEQERLWFEQQPPRDFDFDK